MHMIVNKLRNATYGSAIAVKAQTVATMVSKQTSHQNNKSKRIMTKTQCIGQMCGGSKAPCSMRHFNLYKTKTLGQLSG